jgi:hypothetical protein
LTGALELEIDAVAIRRDLFAQQDRASIAERREVPELVAGVGLRERPRAVRQPVARKDRRAFRAVERVGVQAECCGERPVEDHHPRLAHLRGDGR